MIVSTNIYTYVDKDGTNVHINSDGLRLWCLKHKPEIFNVPLNPDVAVKLLREKTVSMDRCKELILRPHLDPIIYCKDGTYNELDRPNVMMVDGHHRYIIGIIRHQQFIEAHLLELEQWLPFKLEGLPSVTAQELIDTPVTKRNY